MPWHWWPSLDAMSAVIEAPGPWPSPAPHWNGTFVPLDVDKYDGLGVVVGYGPTGSGKDGVGFDDFQVMDGSWQRLGEEAAATHSNCETSSERRPPFICGCVLLLANPSLTPAAVSPTPYSYADVTSPPSKSTGGSG